MRNGKDASIWGSVPFTNCQSVFCFISENFNVKKAKMPISKDKRHTDKNKLILIILLSFTCIHTYIHIYMLLTIIYIHTQNAHYIICIYRLYIIHNIICIMFQWTAVLQLNYPSMTKTLGLFLLFVKWYCKNHICRFITRQIFKIDLCMWNGYINNFVHVVLMSTDKIGFENATLIYTPKNSEGCHLCFNMFTNMCKIICANKTNEKNHCVL